MHGIVRPAIAILAFFCLTPVCSSQALVEYGAAAAVGAAGSAGGKGVSNAIDRIFKKTDSTLRAQPTTQAPTTPQRHKQAEAEAAVASAIPAAGHTTARRSSRPSIAGTVVSITPEILEPPPSALAAEPAPPPPSVVTAEDIASIAPGDTRQKLLSQAGQPAYRVRISGDGHVQEFYRYASGGTEIGSVRVTDGTVTAVRIKNN